MSVAFTRSGCLFAGLLVIVGIAAAAPKGTGGNAAVPTAPKSIKARQAQIEYDRAVKEAELVFEKARADADAKRRKTLQTAMDDALANKDLDDANKIKALIGDKPAAGLSKDEAALTSTVWHRFGTNDQSNATIKLLPDGKLEAAHTGWTSWRLDGETMLLLKGEKVSARYIVHRDVAVMFSSNGKEWGVLVPSATDQPALVTPQPTGRQSR